MTRAEWGSTSATLVCMDSVGLRELRQNASKLVRRVEAGEAITITVSGRPVAQLSPVRDRRWRRVEDIQHLFRGPEDSDWPADRDLIDGSLRDPFEQ